MPALHPSRREKDSQVFLASFLLGLPSKNRSNNCNQESKTHITKNVDLLGFESAATQDIIFAKVTAISGKSFNKKVL